MVLPDSDDVSRVPPYSGSWTEGIRFRLRDYHSLWCSFPTTSTIKYFCNSNVQSYNPEPQGFGLGCSPFARRYLGNRNFFIFLWVLRCFSSPRLPLHSYVFTMQWPVITLVEFSHSEISGSKLTYSSPKLIAVSCVLHRLLVPRHSPCALINLTYNPTDYKLFEF